MLDVVWLNLVELSKQKTFREILSAVVGAEKECAVWMTVRLNRAAHVVQHRTPCP